MYRTFFVCAVVCIVSIVNENKGCRESWTTVYDGEINVCHYILAHACRCMCIHLPGYVLRLLTQLLLRPRVLEKIEVI